MRFFMICLLLTASCSKNGGSAPPVPPKEPGQFELTAPPGQVALQVLKARQTSGGDLQISVALANGKGGAAVMLNPVLFQVMTLDGLLTYPRGAMAAGAPGGNQAESAAPAPTMPSSDGISRTEGPLPEWLVPGADPDVMTSLAGGYNVVLRLAFPLGGRKAASLIFNEFGAAAAAVAKAGAARTASSAVAIEPCTVCGNTCTYLDLDPNNCGACGTALSRRASSGASVAACVDGKPSCGSPRETLCGAPGAYECADLQTDRQNCGACGVRLGDELVFHDQNPAPSCVAGKPTCAAEGLSVCLDHGYALCADLATDPRNCGSCGTKLESASCRDGAPECFYGEMPVKVGSVTKCLDLKTDAQNCGAGGRECAQVPPLGVLNVCTEGRCGAQLSYPAPAAAPVGDCRAFCAKFSLECDDGMLASGDTLGGVHIGGRYETLKCSEPLTLSSFDYGVYCGCSETRP